MGNIIISGDTVSVADANITARTENASYPKVNVMDMWHAVRCFRASDVTANDYLLKFDFGAAQTLAGVFLNDVNFDTVKIQGNASDSWGSPSYAGSDLSVSLDERVQRYKIYIPLTGFTYQYLRIFIPAGTSEVGTSISEWKIGTAVFLSAVTTLSENMKYGYRRTAEKSYVDNSLIHGGIGRSSLGDRLGYKAQLIFGARTGAEESEMWTINAYDISRPVVLYENLSDTSKAYLCLKDQSYEGAHIQLDLIEGNEIQFVELI